MSLLWWVGLVVVAITLAAGVYVNWPWLSGAQTWDTWPLEAGTGPTILGAKAW